MATLQEKLDAFRAGFEAKVPDELLAIMHKATDDLRNSGILDKTIKIGDSFPEFSLPNQDGSLVNLKDLLAEGPLVVSFFRGVWCPYCNIELTALGDSYNEIRELGANMVVISPQVSEYAKQAKQNSNCDVLLDQANAFAGEVGTAFQMPEDLINLYKNFGVKMAEFNGDDSWTLPMPLRAVVDTNGIVRYLDINPDYRERPAVTDTLSALKAVLAVPV